MTSITVIEADLLSSLRALKQEGRVAFAAACAERLMPFYDRFSVSIGRDIDRTIRGILERVWGGLGGPVPIDISRLLGRCDDAELLIDQGEWTMERAGAEDAVAALAYALRCWKSADPQEAVWAARRACEAIDAVVEIQNESSASAPASLGYEHPLVQAKLARQRRDLEELLGQRVTVAQLRMRAQEESLEMIKERKTD
jgi:hypothetical protein